MNDSADKIFLLLPLSEKKRYLQDTQLCFSQCLHSGNMLSSPTFLVCTYGLLPLSCVNNSTLQKRYCKMRDKFSLF